MAGFEKQTLVNAPSEKVFSYVTDFARHPEWAQHRLKIEQTSQGPVGVGSTFASVGHAMGMDSRDTVTVTDYVSNERLGYEAESKEGRFRHWITLQPADGGTRLSKGIEVVRASLMTKLMMPLLLIMGPRILASDVQRIKAKVEGEAGR